MEMLGHVSQINIQRISIYTFRSIKATSGIYKVGLLIEAKFRIEFPGY